LGFCHRNLQCQFDFNTLTTAITDLDITSSGPMGQFSFVSNFGSVSSPILDFNDPLGDGIQIGNFSFGNPNAPFSEIGSQLQIVLDFCAICSSYGVYVGQGGVVQVSQAPEPPVFLTLALTLLVLCAFSSRYSRRAEHLR
jgi:hypothetical protein